MTYREIYENALRMICEDSSVSDTSDYEERAAYILATLISECAAVDKQYRLAEGLDAISYTPVACVELDAAFTLCEALIPIAVYYLSAILVLDENEDMSEKFFSLYTDALTSFLSSLNHTSQPIADRYGLM